MKYIIIPKSFVVDRVEAETPEEAMCKFALLMDSDMNTYFSAFVDPADENRADT